MTRLWSAIVLLLLVCSIAGLAATVLPVAGTCDLAEQLDMNVPGYETSSKERGTIQKPEHLKLDIPMMDSIFYYTFRLGEEGRPYSVVFGRAGAKSINIMYFDADGDGSITKNEAVPMTYFFDFDSSRKVDYWFSTPVRPLQVELEYKRADGTAHTRKIAFFIQPGSSQIWQDTKGTMETYLSVRPSTWFLGEVPAAGNRVMKAAVVDGDMNGLFNDEGRDFLLIDSNYDGQFDWKKEKTAIGGSGISGQGTDGKKAKLIPFVAAWPQKLVLAPKGAALDPAQLEQ